MNTLSHAAICTLTFQMDQKGLKKKSTFLPLPLEIKNTSDHEHTLGFQIFLVCIMDVHFFLEWRAFKQFFTGETA